MILFAIGMPGPLELCILGVVGVVLFGNQLPKIANSIGRAIPSFKSGLKEVESEFEDIDKAMKA